MGKKARRRAAGGPAIEGLLESLARAEARVRRIVASIRAIEDRAVVVVRGRKKARGLVRPVRDQDVLEALARLLKGRSLSVAEAAAGVGRIRGQVGRLLATSPRFRRVARGRYTSDG